MLVELGLVILGIVLLLAGMLIINSTAQLAKQKLPSRRWYLLAGLVLLFVLGYIYELLDLLSLVSLPISPETTIAIVYFGGAIFVVFYAQTTHKILGGILGRQVSDQSILDSLKESLNFEVTLEQLRSEHSIICDHCEKPVSYSLRSVVQDHFPAVDAAITVISAFGVQQVVLHPWHLCTDGFREIPVRHDQNLEYRSHDKSRVVFRI